ncbi:membrane dipeptidase [Arsukibacterium tuosuense]|uniref:Membrane dipeptidase n=1 Tax=Arsukibacterium tuosuense TaxID=1323745 RepID=A0A285IC25_9GAMM|nr:dipeptidase [Arsukibacterium tuosuense]SNY45337.1 membrane dipeptidase [Arsukibacterium tuosuense]
MTPRLSLLCIALLSAGLTACSSPGQLNSPAATQPAASELSVAQRARLIAQNRMIIDTHIDVPYRLHKDWEDVSQATERGEFDYPRARAGGLNVPFMSVYIPASYERSGGGYQLANQLIDNMEALAGRAPDKFAMAHSTDDALAQFGNGKISLALGMENGTPIAGDLANLRHFYQRGIRYITLAHSESNHISDSSYDLRRRWQGLSPFGKELVVAMNNIGMMIDISHVSDDAFYQTVALSKVPVIASHSSLRSFVPGFERNMDDDMIKALAKNGGVIQINFGSSFVTAIANQYGAMRKAAAEKAGVANDAAFAKVFREQQPYPFATLETVLDHIDHVVKLVGIDYVGIGSDYDGVGDSLPEGLKDVASYPNLIAGLLERGYSEADIDKILSGNLLRVWRQAEAYAAKQ